ncbi:Uncharacterised protein [Legionella lansingensis]|uniref:Uncharacterized protein n=1 Tax=Legionella lansingensis TaxID=45067 RepID=A0A0W0VQF2_9GAMM|nr:hypothetical protein [Legionella lansingensis]KTD22157.1 hypothetical protein Llan_1420 [Legionella lansingensis]SNV54569.1 Uncharacterised protein [Legionella lansingensis]
MFFMYNTLKPKFNQQYKKESSKISNNEALSLWSSCLAQGKLYYKKNQCLTALSELLILLPPEEKIHCNVLLEDIIEYWKNSNDHTLVRNLKARMRTIEEINNDKLYIDEIKSKNERSVYYGLACFLTSVILIVLVLALFPPSIAPIAAIMTFLVMILTLSHFSRECNRNERFIDGQQFAEIKDFLIFIGFKNDEFVNSEDTHSPSNYGFFSPNKDDSTFSSDPRFPGTGYRLGGKI